MEGVPSLLVIGRLESKGFAGPIKQYLRGLENCQHLQHSRTSRLQDSSTQGRKLLDAVLAHVWFFDLPAEGQSLQFSMNGNIWLFGDCFQNIGINILLVELGWSATRGPS